MNLPSSWRAISPKIDILITADNHPSVKLRALDEGIDIFIEKPFSVKAIKEIVKDICQSKEQS